MAGKKPVDKGYPRSINYPDGTWITVLNSKEYNSVMAMYLTSAKDFSIERWRASNK